MIVNLENIVLMCGGHTGRADGGRGVEGSDEVLEGPHGFIVQHLRVIEAGTRHRKSMMIDRDGIMVLVCSEERGICCAGLGPLLLNEFQIHSFSTIHGYWITAQARMTNIKLIFMLIAYCSLGEAIQGRLEPESFQPSSSRLAPPAGIVLQ